MKMSCILFCGLLIVSASLTDCLAQNEFNSDAELIAEYLVINFALDSVFVKPLNKLASKGTDIDVESLGISTAIAKWESLFRSYQKLTRSCKETFSELRPKIRSLEVGKYAESIVTILDEYDHNLKEAIEIFGEIDGSTYRFMARSEEILELMPNGSEFTLATSETKKSIMDAVRRTLGW